MKFSLRWLALAGLVLGSHWAGAQTGALLKTYAALPVRGRTMSGGNLSFPPYQVSNFSRNFFTVRDRLTLGVPGIVALYSSSSKNQLQFTLENSQQHLQAEVFALADLKLRGNVFDNLNNIRREGRDSAEWGKRNVDAFLGEIAVVGQPTAANWRFAVENSNQIGRTPLRGTLSSPTQRITFAEVNGAVGYAETGGMSAALLAAHVQRGFLFSYEGKAVAALDLAGQGDILSRFQPVFWVKKDLDPTMQLVVACMATALLTRPVVK